ncbi:hypothetical protein BKA62DRAFT_683162 [Auriculariales sp. MPI-PUGE-AT-0066]|nr:hypothetical protein BKA62DRAFT_683162 [Auriculariales sp. MPI-PUGE-AT-0066]
MSTLPTLPVELLGEVFLAAAPYSLTEKLACAAVSSYWRASALDTHLLWSRFELDCSNAHVLPMLLERGGDAPLDILLDLGNKHTDESESSCGLPVPVALRDQVALALCDAQARQRLSSLKLTFNTPGAFNLMLCAKLDFPQLVELEINRQSVAMSENLSLLIDAPRLRQLRLCRVDPRNWDDLLVPKLDELHIEHAPGEVHFGLLGKASRCCPLLRRLTLATYNAPPPGMARVLLSKTDMSLLARPAVPALLCAPPIDDNEAERQLLERLESFELEVPNDSSSLHVFNSLADANIRPRRMATSVRNGWAAPTTQSVFTSLLRGLGPITEFELLTSHVLTLRDDDGRERTFRVWDARYPWELANVWTFLSRTYEADKTLRKFKVLESLKNTLEGALAVVGPTSPYEIQYLMA